MRMRKEQHHNQQGSRMKMKSQNKTVAATPNQEYHAQMKSFHQQWTLVKAVGDNRTRVFSETLHNLSPIRLIKSVCDNKVPYLAVASPQTAASLSLPLASRLLHPLHLPLKVLPCLIRAALREALSGSSLHQMTGRSSSCLHQMSSFSVQLSMHGSVGGPVAVSIALMMGGLPHHRRRSSSDRGLMMPPMTVAGRHVVGGGAAILGG